LVGSGRLRPARRMHGKSNCDKQADDPVDSFHGIRTVVGLRDGRSKRAPGPLAPPPMDASARERANSQKGRAEAGRRPPAEDSLGTTMFPYGAPMAMHRESKAPTRADLAVKARIDPCSDGFPVN